MNWLKHAFAVDPPGPAQPDSRQSEVIDILCREIIARGLATPTRLFLESTQPLSFIGANALHFLNPFISVLTDSAASQVLAEFLERRGSLEFIVQRLEEMENEPTPVAVPSDADSFETEDKSDVLPL